MVPNSQWLLDHAWAPITDQFGFLRIDCNRVCDEFVSWQSTLPGKGRVLRRSIDGPLPVVLKELLPLTNVCETRYAFVPTASDWTAFFSNGFRGTDESAITVLVRRLSCDGLRVTCSNRKDVEAVGMSTWGDHRRAVVCANDHGKWTFSTVGTPFQFEHTERYQAKRKRDRLSCQMLGDYLRHLGIDVASPALFRSPALLVETEERYPHMREFTLAEALNPP